MDKHRCVSTKSIYCNPKIFPLSFQIRDGTGVLNVNNVHLHSKGYAIKVLGGGLLLVAFLNLQNYRRLVDGTSSSERTFPKSLTHNSNGKRLYFDFRGLLQEKVVNSTVHKSLNGDQIFSGRRTKHKYYLYKCIAVLHTVQFPTVLHLELLFQQDGNIKYTYKLNIK